VTVGGLSIKVAVLRMNLAIALVDSLLETISSFSDALDDFSVATSEAIQTLLE
jgi:hypothetical protein